MMEVAGKELEVAPADLETDGRGRVLVKGAPERGIDVTNVALAAHFKYGKTISGRGMFLKPKSRARPRDRRDGSGLG